MVQESETALICDFAEYYHVLDWHGLPLQTAAALASGLREDSRSMMRLTKSKVSSDTMLKALMVDRLGLLVWAKSKDAQKNKNRPPSILDIMLRSDEPADKKTKAFATSAEFEAARARLLKGG